LPAEVALKFEEVPEQIVEGAAVTGVGAANVVTVTVTGVRVADTQAVPE
jgi:hypothetical protein